MKTIALLLFLTIPSIIQADDDDGTSKNLLKNGDFSSGINHWEGNCHTPDSSSFDPTVSTPTTGVVVKLRHDDWTQVTQDFNGKIGEYVATVTYTVSPDLKFSTKVEDYISVPSKLGFTALSNFDSPPGDWILFINDLGAMHYNYWRIKPRVDAPGAQKLTVNVQLDSDDSEKKGFFLAFPPGDGFITLQSIELVPKAATTAAQ